MRWPVICKMWIFTAMSFLHIIEPYLLIKSTTHSNLEFLNADLQISEGIWQNILMPEKQPHYADQMMWEFWSKFMENYDTLGGLSIVKS